MKCAAVAKVVRPNSDVTQDICPKVHGNPSSSCWDMSARTAGPAWLQEECVCLLNLKGPHDSYPSGSNSYQTHPCDKAGYLST